MFDILFFNINKKILKMNRVIKKSERNTQKKIPNFFGIFLNLVIKPFLLA